MGLRMFVKLCLVNRIDAGKVELDGAQYLGFRLPFTISQLCWIEAILVGGAEIYRNSELNPSKRIYPGVLSLAPRALEQDMDCTSKSIDPTPKEDLKLLNSSGEKNLIL